MKRPAACLAPSNENLTCSLCPNQTERYLKDGANRLCVNIGAKEGGNFAPDCCAAKAWLPGRHCPVLAPEEAHSVASSAPTYCRIRNRYFCRVHRIFANHTDAEVVELLSGPPHNGRLFCLKEYQKQTNEIVQVRLHVHWLPNYKRILNIMLSDMTTACESGMVRKSSSPLQNVDLFKT
jgi:hypothetical protein